MKLDEVACACLLNQVEALDLSVLVRRGEHLAGAVLVLRAAEAVTQVEGHAVRARGLRVALLILVKLDPRTCARER